MKLADKILVVFPFDGKPNAGGPEGFISQLLRSYQHPRFAVTPPTSVTPKAKWRRILHRAGLLCSPRWTRLALKDSGFANKEAVFRQAEMDQVKYLWFMDHNVFGLYEPFISDEQIVIYQPHCPELPWREVPEEQQAEMETLVRRLMARAQILVFPNSVAGSIYASIIEPRHQIHYIQSGVAYPDAVGHFPLDLTLTYFLYIGRRLPIKGFDLVIDAFRLAYEKRKDIRLVVCGGGDAIHIPGVIDVGFSTRIHDWIASVDYVVNANRQSYFDISVMETLAIGTPIIMTATYGHEVFQEWASPGIHCLKTASVADLSTVFLETSSDKSSDAEVRANNRELYEREFSLRRYHQRLEQFINAVTS